MNPTNSDQASGSGTSASPVMIGCVILFVLFFLPWVDIFGTGIGGHQVHQLSNRWTWLWAIPVASATAPILAFSGKRYIEVAQMAGGLPLVGLAIALYQNGADLFQGLKVGGWATLPSGIFLLCVAPRMGKTQPSASKQKQGSPEEHETGTRR